MTSDQIVGALKSEPFRPFILKTASGQEFRIDHPEIVVLSPGRRTVYVFEKPDGAVIIDLLLVESIRFTDNGRGRSRKSA